MIPRIKENSFIWLTFSLVVMLILSALTDVFPDIMALHLLQYANILLLLIALQSLRQNRSWARGLLSLIAIMLVVEIVRSATEIYSLQFVYVALLLAFFVVAAWLVGRQVLLTGSVDTNKIIGSIALYLLLGLIWSVVYTILLEISPNAFHGIESKFWNENMPEVTYFSFVTLTTLGYGDISPATPVARILVILEAVIGVFYMAVVVASLIGAMRENR